MNQQAIAAQQSSSMLNVYTYITNLGVSILNGVRSGVDTVTDKLAENNESQDKAPDKNVPMSRFKAIDTIRRTNQVLYDHLLRNAREQPRRRENIIYL